MAPIGSHGDTRPLVALALKLRERGHRVDFCSTEDDRHWLTGQGFTFRPIKYDFMKNMQRKNELGGTNKKAIELTQSEIGLQFEALNNCVNDYDMIFGSGIQFAAASVAERFNKTYYHLFYTPQIFPSAYHPPIWIENNKLPRFINRQLWKMVNRGINRALGSVVNRYRVEAGLKELTDFSSYYIEKAVLSVDSELAPLPPDVKESFIHINYCFLNEEGGLSPELEKFIAGGEPPIYIGFGSMIDHDHEQLYKIIEALAARYKLRFIVSKGELNFKVSSNPNIHLTGHQPHHKLFPRMAAVVHHGGMGTTYTALRSGVPQVVIPHHLDQYYYCLRLHKLGIAPKAVTKRKMAKKLYKTILEAIYEGGYKKQAKKMQRSLDGHNGADELIEKLGL